MRDSGSGDDSIVPAAARPETTLREATSSPAWRELAVVDRYESRGEHRALSGHADAIEAVLVRPARRDVISISRDGTVRRWADDVPDDGTGLRAWLAATSADTVDEFR